MTVAGLIAELQKMDLSAPILVVVNTFDTEVFQVEMGTDPDTNAPLCYIVTSDAVDI